jgi:alkaline phosphatase D
METAELGLRQDLYLNMLAVPKESPLRSRQGVYSSHEYGPEGKRVRVIMLDTRSGRGQYAFSFVGALGVGNVFGKIAPLLAALARSFIALTGLNRRLNDWGLSNYQMLDEKQWRWLEQQLRTSSAQVNILVSSVQVLTRVPSVESWGHFPAERDRLLDLINEAKPRGFVMLSGDVHIGIAAVLDESTRDSPLVEVTSSGLTHTCTAGGIPHFVCALMWNMFESQPRKDSMILSRNFGSIDIDWEAKQFTVSLDSLTDNVTNSFVRSFEPLPNFNVAAVPGITPKFADLILIGSIIGMMLILTIIVRLLFRWR